MGKPDDIIQAFMSLRNATMTIENAKSNLLGPITGNQMNAGSVLFAIETAERHLANARAALSREAGHGG